MAPITDLHLTNDVGQPFAARIFAFNRFVGHSIGNDEEDFRQIGVVWSEDNGIVAVKKTNHKLSNHFEAPGLELEGGKKIKIKMTVEMAQTPQLPKIKLPFD